MSIQYVKLPDLSTQQIKRFYSKIRIQGECWIWSACASKKHGYGIIRSHGHSYLVHRVAYKIGYQTDPYGFLVCHSCDTPLCVNPLHLFLGNHVDNAQDAIRKGRFMSLKGEDNPLAKLTADDVRAIRKLHQNGASQKELAERFHIQQPHVSRKVFRQAWKHIK